MNAERKDAMQASRKADAHKVSGQVGERLRTYRKATNLSIRALAEKSGLSVNTLSLIENGKTSPSVSTLHQLAQSLNIPIASFFEEEQPQKRVVYQRAGERQQIVFSHGHMEKLGEGMPRLGSEPFIIKLESSANSGNDPIVYAGRQFIYCLEGHITYMVNGDLYPLAPGDSLIFDAFIPHRWQNTAATNSRALLVLCPIESADKPPERFFMP